MSPLRFDSWGFWPQSVLSGLAILLAGAVLALALFPLAHGSFISTHGPATALRSRRLFHQIYLWLAMLTITLAGLFSILRVCLKWFASAWIQHSLRDLPQPSVASAVLLC